MSFKDECLNHSLKTILVFSGGLGSLFCMFGLEPIFEISPAESTGPISEFKSSKTPQNISPLPLLMQMDV